MNRRFLLITLAFTLFACSSPADNPALPLWKKHCLVCHGPDGRGKTPTGRVLKIVDLTSDSIQKTYSDEGMRETITNGVRDDNGHARMAAFGQLLSPEEVEILVHYVRELAE